jgi:adenosine kinase
MAGTPSIIINGALAYDDSFLYSGRIKDHMPAERDAPFYLNLRAPGPERSLGGCGGNVAYTLSLLKAAVGVHSWVGKDGAEYLERLRGLGVDVGGVVVANDVFTSRAVLLADSAGDQILFFGEPPRPVRMRAPDLRPYTLAIVTAGIPAYSLEFLAACRKSRLSFILDPGKFIMDVEPAALREAITGADALVFNEYEYRLLLEHLAMTADELESRVSSIVVTRGSDGMLVITGGSRQSLGPIVLGNVLDPNGAGDAFLAGYSFGRYNGFSPGWSARMGATAASFALEASGAQNHLFSPEAFNARLALTYGEPEKAGTVQLADPGRA